MKLHAYVLAGDPAWAIESIGSYYGLVDRIVVSFDRTGRSWSGRDLPVTDALERIARSDPDRKTVLLPGHHAGAPENVLVTETAQRQHALDAASEGADWVMQLDTDEIVLSREALQCHLHLAAERSAEALDYPLRGVHVRTSHGRHLEHSTRLWRPRAGYPGPVAVTSGTRLSLARQSDEAAHYRVDLAPWNTDPSHPHDARVHAVVRPDEAIAHMSWVREPREMAVKHSVSGYAADAVWSRNLQRWEWAGRHPILATAVTPFARDPFRRLRIVRLPLLGDGRDRA